jgi:hypothetical protein
MSNTITNPTIAKMMSSPPNGDANTTQIPSNKIITKGGKRKSKRRKRILGGATNVAVNNTPQNVVSPGVLDIYKQLNQAQATNSVQSMTDGGRRRKKRKSRKRKRTKRRRSI